MTHDWSHIDEAAARALMKRHGYGFTDTWPNILDGFLAAEAKSCVNAAVSAITPSDLAALIAEKCPGWKCVPVEPTHEMLQSAEEMYMPFGEMIDAWDGFVYAAPKLGVDN